MQLSTNENNINQWHGVNGNNGVISANISVAKMAYQLIM
jgi:hypothetical protein